MMQLCSIIIQAAYSGKVLGEYTMSQTHAGVLILRVCSM